MHSSYVARVLTSAAMLAAWPDLQVGQASRQDPAPLKPAASSITVADCVAEKVGASIPASRIGEPVSAVTLASPRWMAASGNTPAHCAVDGAMAPIDTSATAKP